LPYGQGAFLQQKPEPTHGRAGNSGSAILGTVAYSLLTRRCRRGVMMISKRGRFYGQYDVMACDGRCDKAWGINGRPRLYFMEEGEPPRVLHQEESPIDEDDYVYWKDSELGVAPGPCETRGASEGGECKPSTAPLTDGSRMNKWCLRECERSETFKEGDPIVLRDLEHPKPNLMSRWPR